MAHPNELLGKFFNYSMDQGGIPANLVVNNGIARDSYKPVITHTRGSAGGPISNTWRFNYLIYRPGYVSRCPLNTPVLTGPMSGCLLTTYTKGGKSWAAHIGTDTSATHSNTVQAKQYWTTYAGTGLTNLAVGDPFNTFSHLDFMPFAPDLPTTYGYLTSTHCYALLVRTKRSQTGLTNEILKVRQMPMVAWNAHPKHW